MKSEADRARAQFDFEREHRSRILKSAKGPQRTRAFIDAYSGFAEGVRSGTFLRQESNPEQKAREKFRLLRKFLRASDAVAEIGPGEYALAKIVAKQVRALALVDVVRPADEQLPAHCRVYVGDGAVMPARLKQLNMIWSAHVIEHMHPKALAEHLRSVRNALVYDGHYIIFTPNRFTGPHDISRRFSSTAQGLHLKEYTVTEMRRALLKTQFKKILCYAGGRGIYLRLPIVLPLFVELILSLLPFSIARYFARLLPFQAILGIIVVARK